MSVLTEIVRNILVIIIMASFLELLLPEGHTPFCALCHRAFVLIAVLNPVLGYFLMTAIFKLPGGTTRWKP